MGKMRLVDAGPLEEFFDNKAKSWAGTWSGPTYSTALERVKAAPTVEAVPAEEYNALKEKYNKLMETADILDAALREYQRKYGE